jgi:hypothetical protein
MTAYLYNYPSGVVGDVSRLQDSVVEPVILGEAFTAFGKPFKFNGSGQAINIGSGDAATDFKGIITRVVPAISGSTVETFAGGIPNQEAPNGALREGFGIVLCPVGTPVKGGQVYMRITADTGKFVGDFETAADSGKCVALPGVEWATNGKDASNIAEIYIKYS